MISIFFQKSTSTAPSAAASTSAPAGDLMADLHRKLAMRRKGISGLKENEQSSAAATTASKAGPSNIMDSISSMIPPPPPKQHSDDEDDDNNDANDSDWD